MIWVPGIPLTAGSGDRTMTRIAGRVCWVGPYIDTSDRKTKKRKSGGLKRWKTAIAEYAHMAGGSPAGGPMAVEMTFYFPRPAKPKHLYPIWKQDVDKLARAVLDALTGIAYVDDGQVCQLYVGKYYDNQGLFVGRESRGSGVAIAWSPVNEDEEREYGRID